jgi:hypothetical protein
MDGIVFVAALIAGVTIAGIRSRRSTTTPGMLVTLSLLAGSIWYVFA